MRIYSVYDSEFKSYGRVVTGLEEASAEIMQALKQTPLPKKVDYVPSAPELQNLPAATQIRTHCFGGMPVQIGWCNGHNSKLNCLEYHRDSEFNLGTENFILLLAKQNEIQDGFLDTSHVMAFEVPAGVLVEIYATTLHYAPCHCDEAKGFRVMVALPWLTNTEKPAMQMRTEEDAYMTACNKWLLAHSESEEAAKGAKVGLKGNNIDLSRDCRRDMMRIFHLDAGRKYYSPEVIMGMIDTLSRAGFTHIQLYMSDNQGFRFALPDMIVKTVYGTYDLTPALGDGYCHKNSRPSGCGQYLRAADLEKIIAYAREKGMDVIPGINMPGHMGTILQKFPHLRYPGSRSSLNLADEEAVAFALAILKKHVDFFADLGCKFFLIGADEYANDISDTEPLEMGFDRIYNDGTMGQFVSFINKAIAIVAERNMRPMAFNDGICYHDDNRTYGAVDRRILVCHWIRGWNGYSPASVKFLQEHGYGLINVNSEFYCGVGFENWQDRAEKATEFNPHLFHGNTLVRNPEGSMMCLWSDRGDHDGQDDGRTVAGEIAPVMKAFGEAMAARE